jgi:hypothetical protein
MDYDVKMVRDGRGGWVYYCEGEVTLPFEWDITGNGFEVYLGPSAEWDEFCKKNNATHCQGRRQQIAERIAEEVRKKKAKKAKVTIDDVGIDFSFKGDWLHSLISRILGV